MTRRAARSWTGIHAQVSHIEICGALDLALGGDGVQLSAMLDEVGGHVSIEADFDREHSGAKLKNAVSVIPAGSRARARSTTLRQLNHLLVRFDRDELASLFDEPVDLDLAFTGHRIIADPTVLGLCRLLAERCETSYPGARLAAEGISVALVSRLLQLNAAHHAARATGGLTARQLRTVFDFIEANYRDDLSLEAIADQVGLSASYFSRAFKKSTDRSPYRWLIEHRCVRVKELLLQTDLTLSEVADATGFADHAHLTRTFAHCVGMPPIRWRRAQVSSARRAAPVRPSSPTRPAAGSGARRLPAGPAGQVGL